jgi:hypothetical protein
VQAEQDVNVVEEVFRRGAVSTGQVERPAEQLAVAPDKQLLVSNLCFEKAQHYIPRDDERANTSLDCALLSVTPAHAQSYAALINYLRPSDGSDVMKQAPPAQV